MTPTTNHKLIEEIERLVKDGDSFWLGVYVYEHLEAILAALRASDTNEADAKIMKLVRECYKTGFICSNRSGRFGEDECGQCDACKLSSALASPSSSAGDGGKV
jgi:hypothetical protein